MKMKIAILTTVFLLPAVLAAAAQNTGPNNETAVLAGLIRTLKEDERGPFQAIRWFCPDGTQRPPSSPCPQKGGFQRAIHKDAVTQIGKKYGIHLGQILMGTDHTAFLDADNGHSRLKQYILEKYLRAIDDGWILRKARYYRGAYQAEDEEAWGRAFLLGLLAQDTCVTTQFFLCREAVRALPHRTADDATEKIRALSLAVNDSLADFRDLRIKIHGHPDAGDAAAVAGFRTGYKKKKISAHVDRMLQELERQIAKAYENATLGSLQRYRTLLPRGSVLAGRLQSIMEMEGGKTTPAVLEALAKLLLEARERLPRTVDPQIRLLVMDLSLDIETVLLRSLDTWKPATAGDALTQCRALTAAATGCGLLELTEWAQLKPRLTPAGTAVPFAEFSGLFDACRRAVDWSTGTVRVFYEPVITLYQPFEPLSAGLVDDRIHSSLLLFAGEAVGRLGEFRLRKAGNGNYVMGGKNHGRYRGVNPGYAKGTLVFVTDDAGPATFDPGKIYAMPRPPADLKPVAGIITATEGSAVSHVQLLARNLGIPNAVASEQALLELKKYEGTELFYAVSPGGTVILKTFKDASATEKALFTVQKRPEAGTVLDTKKIDLAMTALRPLGELRAHDSGRFCGPKAANLGQLANLFPKQVAPGFVIPFGVFQRHMQQSMPGTGGSYWDFLAETLAPFKEGNIPDETVFLERLTRLRDAITAMPLQPALITALREAFTANFGKPSGEVPVFIRSDTNVEDLKDFSGAGLNLTVPNVAGEKNILQAIRNVWASPYTERSYRWRQKFLKDPLQVYPSILVLKSVDCDKSGVMVTTGVYADDPARNTVSFSRGVGGAVDGQWAETYELLPDGGTVMLSPAREPLYTALPATGGIRRVPATFERPVLSPAELGVLNDFAGIIRKRLPGTPGITSDGPFDIELGFKGTDLWLFQVRPYVENKKARSSGYLKTLDPPLPAGLQVQLTDTL